MSDTVFRINLRGELLYYAAASADEAFAKFSAVHLKDVEAAKVKRARQIFEPIAKMTRADVPDGKPVL